MTITKMATMTTAVVMLPFVISMLTLRRKTAKTTSSLCAFACSACCCSSFFSLLHLLRLVVGGGGSSVLSMKQWHVGPRVENVGDVEAEVEAVCNAVQAHR